MTRRLDTLTTVSSFFAVLALLLAFAGAREVWARAILGLPLVFVLPGFGLSLALFPAPRLGGFERAALSVGLSLAVTVLLGPVLAATRPGLGTVTWLAALADVTLAANAVAAWRKAEDHGPTRPAQRAFQPAVLIPLVVLGFVGLAVLALGPRGPVVSTEVVQLWAVPSASRVRIGASNVISGTSAFTLEVREGSRVVTATQVVLPPGGTRTIDVPVSGLPAPPIEAYLKSADRRIERAVYVAPR